MYVDSLIALYYKRTNIILNDYMLKTKITDVLFIPLMT